jgi:hypothetical protein
MPAADKPIATINGKDINNARFYALLMEVAGMRVFQQVFELTLVQRACSDAGIPLSGDDFEKRMREELQRTLDGIQGPGLKPEDKPRVLDEILRQRGVTPIEFRMNLEKNAGLRALAAGKVNVTNEDIDDAYDAKYGERAEVLIFDLGVSDNALTTGANLRRALEIDKKTPQEAAQSVGIPAPNSATISKSAHGSGIETLAAAIFTPNRKEGDLTASIPYNGRNLMVQVVKKHPDTRANNPKAAVTDQLRKDVLNLKETNWMNAHMAKLRSEANVQINDPVLSAQFDAILQQIRAQAAATSQPGAAPATMPAGPAAPGRTSR